MKRAAIPVKIKESSIKAREGGMIQKNKKKNKLSLMRKNSTGDTWEDAKRRKIAMMIWSILKAEKSM